MDGVYLFIGENHFALHQKVLKWKNGFIDKHGSENMVVLYGDKLKYRELLDEIASAPFIAEKRLVMIKGLPKFSKDEVQNIAKIKHEDVLLVFVEPKPDKRLSGTKELLAKATVEECKILSSSSLRSWLSVSLTQQNVKASPQVIEYLLERVGEDQAFLYQEILKLGIYCENGVIQKEDIDSLVLCSTEKEVWALMDLIGKKNKTESLRYVKRLLEQGESAQALWAILLWMLSSLAPITSAVREGTTNPGALAKECGVSYGSARALLPIAKTLSDEKLMSIVSRAANGDRDLKTGALKATGEEPQELEALIETTVLSCL